MHAIRLKHVCKRYGDHLAVDDLSLDIPKGSFFGILGLNGAGKSTTISMVSGLATPTSGDLTIFGHDVLKEHQKCRRHIGLAPQDYGFDRFFSIETILIYQAGYFGVGRKLARERAKHYLNTFGLYASRGKNAKQLSGGQKRRLTIIKALMHDPEVLILDEPTAGVDVELRHFLWSFLQEQHQKGKTILLTTHYLEEAEKLCERAAILHEGRLIQDQGMADIQASGSLESHFLKLMKAQDSGREMG